MSLLAKIRTVFTMGRGVTRGLPELTASDDPIAFFNKWFGEAREAGILLPEAMTLATATTDGIPSARMMLLKGVDEQGFVFFTNYESRKGDELADNPRAAIVLHWPILERQVRVEEAVDGPTRCSLFRHDGQVDERSDADVGTRRRVAQQGMEPVDHLR